MVGVKFCNKNYLNTHQHLTKAENLILSFKENQEHTINDILELFNCTLYIENNVCFPDWSDSHKEKLKGLCKGIKGYIARYFSGIDRDNIELYVEPLDFQYKEDFLKLFVQYRVEKRIDENIFTNLLSKKLLSIPQVCQQSKLVDNYETVVKHFILENPSNVELLFNNYVVDSKTPQKLSHLPKSLTKDEVNVLISNYIDSSEANISYLQLIINNHNSQDISVTDEHRWKAKKRKESIEEEYFKNNRGIPYEFEFKLQKSARILLEQELDFETILNNFIFILEFIDMNARITFVSETSTRPIFFEALQLKAKRDYPADFYFQNKEVNTNLSMEFYYQLLKKQNVRLEDILEWFFKVYLKEDFAVSDYDFTAPSEGSSYKEKCRDILPEIEYALQQFKSYVENKLINHEMLSLSSSGIAFHQVPSLINNKYIYATKNLKSVFQLLFSDPMLGYLENPQKNSRTFFDLLETHKVNIDEFKDYQRTNLQYLINNDYISSINGFLRWKNPLRIQILHELYHYNVISMYRLDDALQTEVKLMHQENKVDFESTLFSKPEQNMFDYYLNNSRFQNGPQLRNKYVHGRLGNTSSGNEDINYKNYLLILKLLIVIIIKINEDFCLYEIVNKIEELK
ncbi:hypothetical protein JDS77_29655 [Bacillus cereus group sp. N28]|uniref:hypothetical protein n=1 Tax=Bacillus cereus group TaxID=86661 RepID=UPI0018F3F287|nr:hypothetical protein [Bacillus cereus group sp. N28]MBJ7961763.1 hypothetical protein [Bacillus cereus group sp. N28]